MRRVGGGGRERCERLLCCRWRGGARHPAAAAAVWGGSGAHVSQPMRSVLSRDRDLVLCGEAGLGGLLKVELLEAVECRGESESWGGRGDVGERKGRRGEIR